MISRRLPVFAAVLFVCLPGMAGAVDPVGQKYAAWEATAPESIPGKWRFLGPDRYIPGAPAEALIGGLGRVLDVAMHANDATTLFVATAGSGVWKTDRGGGQQTVRGGKDWFPMSRWIPLTNDLKPVPAVTSLAIDPDHPDTIYALTGRGYPRNVEPRPSSGVLKTTDGGLTWTSLPLPWPEGAAHYAQKVVFNPACKALFAVAWSDVGPDYGGIFRLQDGGEHWQNVSKGKAFQGSFRDLVMHPGDPSVMYVSTDVNVIRLEQCGDGWKNLSDQSKGLPRSDYTGKFSQQRVALAVSPASPDTVYALYAGAKGFAGIYRSGDRGETFALRSNLPNILALDKFGMGSTSIAWFALGVAVSPCNAEEVHVGSYNTWRSADGGKTWNRTSYWQAKDADALPNRYVHIDIQRLVFAEPSGGCGATDPASAPIPTLFALSDGGISMSVDSAESWVDLSAGLAISEVYRLCGSGADLDLLYAGYQDIGTNRLVDGLAIHVYWGDGTYCMIDPGDPKTVYVSYQYGKLFKSEDGARSFVNRTPPSPVRSTTSGILGILWPFVLEPGRPDTIYGCYPDRLWRSEDGGETWSEFGAALPQPGARCVGLAVSKDGAKIFVAKSGAVYRYDRPDSGTSCPQPLVMGAGEGDTGSWCGVTPEPILHGPEIVSIEVFYGSDTVHGLEGLYVLYSGSSMLHAQQTPSRVSGVFRSPGEGDPWNDAATWSEYSEGLPDIPSNTLKLVAADVGGIRSGLYFGMDIGVFFHGGKGKSWRPLGEVGGGEGQLPAVPVMAIDYQTDGEERSRLRVGTLGQGIWEFVPELEGQEPR